MSTPQSAVPPYTPTPAYRLQATALPRRLRNAYRALAMVEAYMDADCSAELIVLRDAINKYLALPAGVRAELERKV